MYARYAIKRVKEYKYNASKMKEVGEEKKREWLID